MKVLQPLQPKNDADQPLSAGSSLPEAAVFILITLTLMFFGGAILYSTSYGVAGTGYFIKQMMWMGVGFCGFSVIQLIGYKKISDWSPWMMIAIGIALCLALLFDPVNGARRWIKVGSFRIQPSEYAKLVLVLFLAKFLSERTRLIETKPFRVFLSAGLFCSPILVLVVVGHDLGTTLLLATVFLAMLFAAGLRLRYILPFVTAGPLLVYLAVLKFSPVRLVRITTFLNPEPVQAGEGYQLWLSELALGSGNWLGVGFTGSRMKQKYLPEAHTDFILSVAGEELGFICLAVVLCLYLVFAVMALRISERARTRQGMLAAFGVMTFVSAQALINMGVISGAFPTKGMPAPFISYGGSNLVTCLTSVGIVFAVALDNAYPDYQIELRRFFVNSFHSLCKRIYTGG